MKLPNIKKRILLFLAFVCMLLVLITTLFIAPFENKNKTKVEPLEFSGSYQYAPDMEPVSLTGDDTISTGANDAITLRGHFGRTLEDGTQIFFLMEYLEVHIYRDGLELYSYGTQKDHPSFLRSAGATWGHVVLNDRLTPEDEVTITLRSQYANNYRTAYRDFLESLSTGDSGALARMVLQNHLFAILSGVAFFLMGLALLLLVLILAWQKVQVHLSTYLCSGFIICTSLWILLDPAYITLLVGNPSQVMLLETVSVWLSATLLCAYLGSLMQTKARKANLYFSSGFLILLLLFMLAQLAGLTDAFAVRGWQNALFVAGAVASAVMVGYELKHAKKSELRILVWPGLVFAAFGLIEIANYVLEWFPRANIAATGFLVFITAQFLLAVRRIRQSLILARRSAELEAELAESRISIMLSQIQPHFLYNSLNTIRCLCSTNPSLAEHAVESFSKYLRGNMDSLTRKDTIPFEQELEHLENYLTMERLRFPDVKIVYDLKVKDFRLPALTVQPLVENAISHGIMGLQEGGTVTISSMEDEKAWYVLVEDDGVGFDPQKARHDNRSHIGIENVRSRLCALCGGTLKLESVCSAGTSATIVLPKEEL